MRSAILTRIFLCYLLRKAVNDCHIKNNHKIFAPTVSGIDTCHWPRETPNLPMMPIEIWADSCGCDGWTKLAKDSLIG
jgi:hypothetical protein